MRAHSARFFYKGCSVGFAPQGRAPLRRPHRTAVAACNALVDPMVRTQLLLALWHEPSLEMCRRAYLSGCGSFTSPPSPLRKLISVSCVTGNADSSSPKPLGGFFMRKKTEGHSVRGRWGRHPLVSFFVHKPGRRGSGSRRHPSRPRRGGGDGSRRRSGGCPPD